ncbi:MAG: tyrosine-type recombinase/integrase [Gammaproteobacteria bacterium]
MCYSAFRESVLRTGIQLPKGQLAHVLRNTFATHYLLQGGSLKSLQTYLGHSTLAQTSIYAHFAKSENADASKRNPLANL